jgi:hypothetical protein
MHDEARRLPFERKRSSEMIHPIISPANPRTADPGRRPPVLQQGRIDRQVLPDQLPGQPTQKAHQNYDYFSHGKTILFLDRDKKLQHFNNLQNKTNGALL